MTREQKIAVLTAARRQRWRDRLSELKDKPCQDCGGQFPHYALDYDHVRGRKVTNLSKLVNAAAEWGRIEAEIAKCDLVCSNCHRIRSWNRSKNRPTGRTAG
jgi:hypothetical protein